MRGGAVSPRAKSWDVAGTGSMVVDEIHLAKRILGADTLLLGLALLRRRKR